jgi:hypothetical protein
MSHDVAPMAGRVPDAEENGDITPARLFKSFLRPLPPINGVFGMLQQIWRCGLPKSIHVSQRIRVDKSGMCKDTSTKGVNVFDGAKKEYDQAIDRNNTLGELANQKVVPAGLNYSRVVTKTIIFVAIAIALALLIIL